MTIQQRRADRLAMEAQREVAARILAELENPTPLKPEVAQKAAAFAAWQRGDSETADVITPPRDYDGTPFVQTGIDWADITTYEDADEDGHIIWTGPTTMLGGDESVPKQYGTHALCGKAHFKAARWAKEDQLGTVLDEALETVNRTCDQPLCVAPDHHIVKER